MTTQEKIEQLKKQIDEIEAKNAFWKRCQDGSYEMALSMAGVYRMCDEIRKLEESLLEE